MAKKTRRTRSGGTSFTLEKFSFWIVVAIGIVMLVSYSLRWVGSWLNWGGWITTVCSWVQTLCFTLGMFVPVVLSYKAARAKGNTWFILWIIFVLLVIFGLVSSIIGLIM